MRPRFALYVVASLVLIVIDSFTPLESVEWILNVLLVWLVSLERSSRYIVWAGIISSFAILAGASLSAPSALPEWVLLTNRFVAVGTVWVIVWLSRQRRAAEERERAATGELEKSHEEIKVLRGIIPICSWCKRIRNDSGAWEQMEIYIRRHSEADFSHGMCEDCLRQHFPEFSKGSSEA